MIPQNPDQLMTRPDLAAALTAAGYPIKYATLQKYASVGGGPAYQMFGHRSLYRWGVALEWARGRVSAPRTSTSQRDAQRLEDAA